jgi:flagellar motor switch protein FliN/FliY
MTQATATEADPAAAEDPQDAEVEVHDAELNEAADTAVRAGTAQIDILLDTTVEIAATLGSTHMPVREVLELGAGAVIALDRAVGEPVDLHLNGIPFAAGTLIVAGDRLGIRIEQVLAPHGDTPPPPQDGAETGAETPAETVAEEEAAS